VYDIPFVAQRDIENAVGHHAAALTTTTLASSR
jgi:hypothetical protein